MRRKLAPHGLRPPGLFCCQLWLELVSFYKPSMLSVETVEWSGGPTAVMAFVTASSGAAEQLKLQVCEKAVTESVGWWQQAFARWKARWNCSPSTAQRDVSASIGASCCVAQGGTPHGCSAFSRLLAPPGGR